LHGRPTDSIPLPLAVQWPAAVRDIAIGGSFSVVLDGESARLLVVAHLFLAMNTAGAI
jgi:hypothetical protein